MRAIIVFSLIIGSICLHAEAEEPEKPQVVSARDLQRGETTVDGLLRKPLGTVQEIQGSSVEPYNGVKIDNSLRVTASANVQWGAGVDIEIRGLILERGKYFHFKGYESGEFVGTPIKDNPDAPPLHYHPFFVVTTQFDTVPTEKHVDVADIKITFAEKQNLLPLSPPKDVRNDKLGDTGDYGPLSKIFAGNIAALQVTSSDPKRFKSETQTADFLRQLLTVKEGRTWKFEIWSQGIQPMLVVTVDHVHGKPGTWYIGPNGENAALSAYQDGNGRWWFSDWRDLTAPNGSK